jgi:hypothetical protein
MVFKQFGVPNVGPKHVHRLVPALVHHLEDRGATRCCTREEAGAQAVTSKVSGIEPNTGSMRLHDVRNALIRRARRLNATALRDGPEHGPSTMAAAVNQASTMEGTFPVTVMALVMRAIAGVRSLLAELGSCISAGGADEDKGSSWTYRSLRA